MNRPSTASPRISTLALLLILALLLVFAPGPAIASQGPSYPSEVLQLRDQGLAQLENEEAGQALETFRKLADRVPEDPLPWANLAIAALREQQNTMAVATIDRALELAPERSDLLHIKGDILQWTGRREPALRAYQAAIERQPDNLEALYSLYRLATQLEGDDAVAAASWALKRLVELRPENLVLLLHRGRMAIDTGDRETASTTFLRVEELAWQGPDMATAAAEKLLEVLSAQQDTSAARVPAARLENVLKITPMYQQGLRELNTGIQGLPVWHFAQEPASSEFGPSLALEWTASPLASPEVVAIASADFDGDQRADLALVGGSPTQLMIRTAASDWTRGASYPAPGTTDVLTVDLDNDGLWDLVALGPVVRAFRGTGNGEFVPATWLPADTSGTQAVALDYDIEGDLDLAVAAPGGLQLWRNLLADTLQPVAARALPGGLGPATGLAVADFDRDGDLDLAVQADALYFLENLRQGQFAAHPTESPLESVASLASGDLDHDGRPDLVLAGRGVAHLSLVGQAFEVLRPATAVDTEFAEVQLLDADNDGRLDLALTGPDGVFLHQQQPDGDFEQETLEKLPGFDLVAGDLDQDGDLDLLVAGPEGLTRFENIGGNENGWLDLRLTGLVKGNSKNNVFGLGSLIELRRGGAYQYREAQGETTHLGLGRARSADLRVVWTNGVPQNRLDVAGNQAVVEEQLLKGSCPFLYTWNGDEFAFVTDLLWGAPIGLPVAEGVFAGADPGELVEVVGAAPRDGDYVLQITEELWEAAFFDQVRLWVVDHPEGVEVASNLKILPGVEMPERIHASRAVRPVAAAWDARGLDVTDRVRQRDEVYADGFERSRYQGRAPNAWTFTFDLGAAPAVPIRLHLDGWIFPSDASLNLAMEQAGFTTLSPRLEVETTDGWQVLMPELAFPAGKTKTMIVDTPALPPHARRLRIVTSLWLGWDRIAWTDEPDDAAAIVQARLEPSLADLHHRGFSQLTRLAPNGPHHYDYAELQSRSPWLPFPGHYTRFGDVTELLAAADDRSVILAAGDEMTVHFAATDLPPLRPGWQRTLFLESQGWDKDADRNTGEGRQVEPLPFRAMTSYPYATGESFPRTPELDRYRLEWLTRRVE